MASTQSLYSLCFGNLGTGNGEVCEDNDIVNLTLQGKFDVVLEKCSLIESITSLLENRGKDASEAELCAALKSYCDQLVDADNVDASERHLICIGGSCLAKFVQSNWVGPISEVSRDVPSAGLLSYFTRYGSVYPLTRDLHLLLVAMLIFCSRQYLITDIVIRSHSAISCLYLLSCLLDDATSLVFEQVAKIEEEFVGHVAATSIDLEQWVRSVVSQTYLILANFYHSHHHSNKGNEYVERARGLSPISVNITGKLGKRTRFQERAIAQPFVEVRGKTSDGDAPTGDLLEDGCGGVEQALLPVNVVLTDDTVLNHILYVGGDGDGSCRVLTADDQLLLLAISSALWRSQPSDPLVMEEIEPYISTVLSQPRHWSIHCQALVQRCRLEKGKRRKLERALMQLEEVVTKYRASEPALSLRLPYLCAAGLPPTWVVEKDLADFNLALGLSSAALDIYLRLELWESAVFCYTSLGRHGKAEEVIQAQLSKQETPLFYCLLADIKEDPDLYQKAWELSGGKFGRAMRSLGYYHLRKKNYSPAVEAFQNALKVNGLDISVWFSLGCAAMALDRYEVSIDAFKRCIMLDSDNFEAWNNLANGYVRTNNKQKAFCALQEALKCNYENWMVWENYLVLAVDCAEFSEVMRAYHRLLDLKDKYVDTKVLYVLVSHVTSVVENNSGDEDSGKLLSKCRELFGRLTSKVTSNGDVWRCYGQLISVSNDDDKWGKVLSMLQKSHRAHMNDVLAWLGDEDRCVERVEQALHLSRVYGNVVEEQSQGETYTRQQLLASDRLTLNALLRQILKHYRNDTTGNIESEKIKECVEKINAELIDIGRQLDVIQ